MSKVQERGLTLSCILGIASVGDHNHNIDFLNLTTTSLLFLPKSLYFPLCIYVLAFSRKPVYTVLSFIFV